MSKGDMKNGPGGTSSYPGKYVGDKAKIKPRPAPGTRVPGALKGPASGKNNMGKSK